jgi:hypothetical protein
LPSRLGRETVVEVAKPLNTARQDKGVVKTYIVTVAFTAHGGTDEHLHSERAVRHEVQSWFESLNATVLSLNVSRQQPAEEER